MTVPSPAVPQETPTIASVGVPSLTSMELDASVRLPALVLFTASLAWLALGGLLAFLSAIKAHAPGFLAAPAALTYGRVLPASSHALIYGFALQAALALSLWMFCRLGRNLLEGPRAIIPGAVVYNIGVLLGLASILAGESSGYLALEMGRSAAVILFVGYALIAVWALITLHLRQVRSFYVSQWFLLTGLLWFPWVFSTATLLLLFFPGRGVLQAVIDGWYRHNLVELCLAPFGLAAIFYFIPKLRKRPLYSEQLALCGFWFLILFGGWGGLRAGEPVPNWITAVSDVARVLLLLPTLAIGLSWYQTNRNNGARLTADPVLRFISVAALSYLLAQLLQAVVVLPGMNALTVFTPYAQGVAQLVTHGFLAMALAGAVYYIVPRLTATEWPAPGLIQVHFWCALAGTAVSTVALLVGGVIEGVRLNQPKTEFIQIVRTLVPFLGTSTLGTTLLFVGYATFLVHLSWVLKLSCAYCCWPPGWGRTGAVATTSKKRRA